MTIEAAHWNFFENVSKVHVIARCNVILLYDVGSVYVTPRAISTTLKWRMRPAAD